EGGVVLNNQAPDAGGVPVPEVAERLRGIEGANVEGRPAQLNRRGGGVVEGRVPEIGERRGAHGADVGEQLDRGAVRADQAGLQVRVVEVANVQLGRHRLD